VIPGPVHSRAQSRGAGRFTCRSRRRSAGSGRGSRSGGAHGSLPWFRRCRPPPIAQGQRPPPISRASCNRALRAGRDDRPTYTFGRGLAAPTATQSEAGVQRVKALCRHAFVHLPVGTGRAIFNACTPASSRSAGCVWPNPSDTLTPNQKGSPLLWQDLRFVDVSQDHAARPQRTHDGGTCRRRTGRRFGMACSQPDKELASSRLVVVPTLITSLRYPICAMTVRVAV
jgi:hypothetical protein